MMNRKINAVVVINSLKVEPFQHRIDLYINLTGGDKNVNFNEF